MKFKYIFIIVLFAAGMVRGEAPLTIDQCITIALRQNPLIRSYRQQHRASVARANQAYAFPQPEISLDYDLQPRFFDLSGSDEAYIGISQLIEFPGRRYLRGKAASKEAKEFSCDLELVKLDLIYQVKNAFYELLLAKEEGKYAEENVIHARDFLSKAREKYDSGDVSRLEVLRARVEAAGAENLQKVALNRIKLARSKLNFVLARDKYRPIDIAGSLQGAFPVLDLDRLTARAMYLRPEMQKARLALQREKLNRTRAYMNYLPDFSLGVARHRITNEPTTWDVSLSFQVPLFFWQNKRGEINEAAANVATKKAELSYTGLSISLEVENAVLNALSFRDRIEFFEKQVLREAEEVYDMSLISYKEGKIGSINSFNHGKH